MATSSKSFQNCTEKDVPGYNDCPSFLFQVNKKAERRHKIATEVKDTYGNTKMATIPPPPRRSSSRTLSSENSNDDIIDPIVSLDKDQILERVNTLLESDSKLPSAEFEFYKKKIDLNLAKGLENDSTKHVMSQFFDKTKDKSEAQKLLRSWMAHDISISNWCPAFLKIFENTLKDDI